MDKTDDPKPASAKRLTKAENLLVEQALEDQRAGKKLSKKQKLLLSISQQDAQLRTLHLQEKKEARLLDEHRKYSVGGHFLPFIEKLPPDDVGESDLLPPDVLAKAMLAEMKLRMKTPHHRKALGLPPLPSDKPNPAG